MIDGYAQWAHQYRSRLWTGVLPLPPRAKSPVPKGFTGLDGATPDDAQIDAWCRRWANGNIALRMPGDVLGIDVDDYPYVFTETDPETGEAYEVTGMKTGGATLAALEAELGPLPTTWRSSSRGDGPSGIRFFKVPPGLLWGDFGLHLEGIWWKHRYAVVYPSINPDSGRQYQWINDAAHEPRWGEAPPKVTDIAELPESWVARFGRTADQPKAPRSAPAVPRRSPIADYNGSRRFTRAQAADFVQPHLDALRHETPGAINNRLNDAAKVISHFVPAFWSPAEADRKLWNALKATAYDGNTWKAEDTIASAFSSATADWVAELAPDRPARVTATPRPAVPDDGEEPPEDPEPIEPPEASGFWESRPALEFVREFALSRYAAPWATLGATLTRAVAAVEPNIQLPPILGVPASLNLFVGLVAGSGGGKDIASGVAAALLDIRSGSQPLPIDMIPLGSGEGLSHIYMKPPPKLTARRSRKGDDEDSETIGLSGLSGGGDEPIQYRTRALVVVSEIDTLDSIGQRKGSTLGPQLRQAWSGSQLGFQYVDSTKRMIVPAHVYRMGLLAFIQPGRAGALLNETDGGTPQRFLWLPAINPEIVSPTDEEIENPVPPMRGVAWQPPQYQAGYAPFDVCTSARRTIVRAHVARQRGDGEALDGHALLTRLKVAAALAMLTNDQPARQCTVTEEDWELSGIVMAVSDRTRAGVQRHLAELAREQNEKQAYAKARESIVITETVENAALARAAKWVGSKIGEEWVTLRSLTQAMKSTIRPQLGVVLDRMLAVGEIEVEEYEPPTGPAALRYRRKAT